MEKDIKILEEYTEKNIPCDSCRYCGERPNVTKAVRNLIARNKELEQNYINPSKARFTYFDNGKGTKVVIEGFIPKSKVREKIEEKMSYCRLEQKEEESTEGKNSLHKKYWKMYEDLLENLKKQILED